MPTVVVDTDVAWRLQRGNLPSEVATALVGSTLALTFVNVAELLVWAETRSWGARRRHELAAWLDATPVLPYSRAVAASWARLTAGARERGRPRPANDTWIAACGLAYDLALATMNRPDFEDFEQHHGLVLLLPPR